MNLQESLLELTNELNYLYLIAKPPEDAQIEKLLDALGNLSLAALRTTINEDTEEFNDALQSIGRAKTDAERAVTDLGRIGQAISNTVKAVKLVDKLLGYVISLAKFV